MCRSARRCHQDVHHFPVIPASAVAVVADLGFGAIGTLDAAVERGPDMDEKAHVFGRRGRPSDQPEMLANGALDGGEIGDGADGSRLVELAELVP